MFEKLTEELNSYIKAGVPGVDCIVYKDGKCIYRYFTGVSDIETQTPMCGNERYNIYSCSKIITATAALQLYEECRLDLDDLLSKYLPEYEHMTVRTENGIVPAERQITIRDLLCMRAGFSYDFELPMVKKCLADTDGLCDNREFARYMANEPLLFQPGERFMYSICHDILAAALEIASGESFAEYVKKHIFEPIGMNDSTFLLPESELDSICSQYEYFPESGELRNATKRIWAQNGKNRASGGGGCVSTVDDYIKFLEALRIGNVILKKETTELMTTNQLNDRQLKSAHENLYSLGHYGYGYGLGVRCPMGDGRQTDFGWNGTAGTYAAVDMKRNMTLFYAQHVLNNPVQKRRLEILPIAQDAIDKM